MPENPKVLTTTEARQASPRRVNLRVLIVSLALCAVVAVILYGVFYGSQTLT